MAQPTQSPPTRRPIGCAFLFLIAGLIVPIVLPKLNQGSARTWTRRDRASWPGSFVQLSQAWQLANADLRGLELYAKEASFVCRLKATRRVVDGVRATWVPIDLMKPSEKERAIDKQKSAIDLLYGKMPRRWKEQGRPQEADYFANEGWEATATIDGNFVAVHDREAEWVIIWCNKKQ